MIVGIDIGLRLVTICDLAADGTPTWRRITAPKEATALEAARTLGALAAYENWAGAAVVWIERPFGKHIRSVSDLSRVFGAVLSAIPSSVAVSEISAPEWKNGVGLRGNAAKEDVQRWARTAIAHSQLGLVAADRELDQHAADSFAIATACWRASEREMARSEVVR